MTSLALPEIFHVGWVVRDCQAAQEELGTRLGGVLLELLEPLDDRSPHAAFLAAHGEGLHHLAFLVDDFDQKVAAATHASPPMDLLIDGTGPGNQVRWVYLDGGSEPARRTVIELIERSELSLSAFAPFLELIGRSRPAPG